MSEGRCANRRRLSGWLVAMAMLGACAESTPKSGKDSDSDSEPESKSKSKSKSKEEPAATEPPVDPLVNPGRVRPPAPPATDSSPTPARTSAATLELMTASAARVNALGLDLYDALRVKPGNVALSPASVHTCLSMSFAGARGNTASQMQAALRLPDADPHEGASTLLRHWNADDPGVKELAVLDRVYVDPSAGVLDAYTALLRDRYAAPAAAMAGSPEENRAEINRWVAEATKDRIPEILPVGALKQAKLVLVNAIYFLGDWEHPFSKSRTSPWPFHLTSTEERSVPTMWQKRRFPLFQGDGVSVLQMPYDGGRFHMVIVLPDEVDGLSAVEDRIVAGELTNWLSRLQLEKTVVMLPRFTVEMPAPISLNQSLQAMGVQDAFTDAADFSGVNGKTDLFISGVYHRAFVRVDEQGSEAAASTAVVAAKKKKKPKDPNLKRFLADHPFVFAIIDGQGDTMMFLGRVTDPGDTED